MRSLILAGLFSIATAGVALADANVAGQWHADMGDNVVINMTVGANGSWSSETLQNNTAVRQMRGTYTQKSANDHTGVLVFTPTESKTRGGKVSTERDEYELSDSGSQLKLTSNGDTMVFEKQSK